ncbi:hypothetical protein A8990_1569 [Paenibacillus taihuensis]|uniref:Sporulation lipoprotein YhcN/YlaJ n=1 Tax=Paenibacillus taihuensis TaxID=1156355 RepID=A0A3D9Q3G5_9BACL|nr:hypothetical protein [Paenibacillus taihuensis]REE57395.1 hypothetical protein A8990_1569 [Paenibacillus taihuensis]
MRSKRLLLGVITVMATISLTACGGNKDATNHYNANSYGHDGYLGLSNSNPHLPNRNGNFLNQNDDGNFAQRQLLQQVSGIKRVNIMFRTPDMDVTITPKAGVNKARLKKEATAVLKKNMPRYNVRVRVT